MLLTALLIALSCLASSLCGADDAPATAEAEQNWPQWRGPLGTGVAPHANPPVEWSESKNVRWKAALPGKGHSTPIVWGDRVVLTTAVPYGERLAPRYSGAPGAHDNLPVTQRHEFYVLALDRNDGEILWQKSVHKELPHEGGHYTGSLASASPVTDGEYVYAHFGSRGLFCLDFDGNIRWQADLGQMNTLHGHGEGSSPALHGETLVVNWDHEGQSFVAAFDTRTGHERWKVLRDEVTSWTTPVIAEHDGRTQVIIAGTGRVRGYNLASGEVLWECGGLSQNVVATPVAGQGLVFAGSSYDHQALLAIRLAGARGDVTDTEQVVWHRRRGTPYVPSPLLYGERLYFLRHYQGVLSRVVAATGEEPDGPFRLGGIRNVYASPVGAAGRVYITDLSGTTLVLSHDEQPRVLAENRLADSFAASAAIAGREMFLRGEEHLYCLAERSAGVNTASPY